MNSQFIRTNKCFNDTMWKVHRTPKEGIGFKPVFAHTGYVSLGKSFNLVRSNKVFIISLKNVHLENAT